MTRLNLNHLYYFWTIAREGSVKMAAQRLHLTQPTLSGQLKSLEEFFEEPLFERRSRKLFLNEAGKLVFEYATRIFALTDEMVETVRRRHGKRVHVLEIGVVPSLSKSQTYEQMLPLLSSGKFLLRLKEAQLKHLVKELDRGNIDFILSDAPLARVRYAVQNYKISPRTLCVVAGPAYSKLKDGFPESLDGLPFLNYTEESSIRADIQRYFVTRGIRPETIGEADDENFLRVAAEANTCFAVLPMCAAVERSVASEKLFLLGTLTEIESSVWLVARRKAHRVNVAEIVNMLPTGRASADPAVISGRGGAPVTANP